MAFIVDAWQADGPKGESALATIRCNKRIEFVLFLARWSKDPRCVLITKVRSDKKSAIMENLWVKEGYSSETVTKGTKAERPKTGRKASDQGGICPCCGQRVTA